MSNPLPSCTNDLSSLPVASGCPAGSERVVMMGVAGGKGASLAALRSVSDLKCFLTGTGSPEGVITAPQAAIYEDTSGPVIYFKTTTSGNTGWVSAGAGAFRGNLGTLNTFTTTYYPTDTGGVMQQAASNAVVDNIRIFNDAVKGKVERVVEGGVFRVSWAKILANGTDYASAFQSLLSDGSIQEVVIDFPQGGSLTMNGAINAGTKKIWVLGGCKITGTCTITGGMWHGSIDQQIFDTSVTLVNPQISFPFFPVAWYGAKGAIFSADDQPAIQKVANTVIANNTLPRDVVFLNGIEYRINSPIMGYRFDGVQYLQNTVNFIGGYSDSPVKFSAKAAIITLMNKNQFAFGFQIAKGGGVQGLRIQGQYVAPTLSDADFYKASFASYGDATCRDERWSPYAAIVVDPFRNNAGLPLDTGQGAGYPGLTSWYTQASGGLSNSGSSGLTFKDLYINNFTLGFAQSPNGATQNGECMYVSDIQFQDVKTCMSSSQDQEKENAWRNIVCWGQCHTIFTNQHYGIGSGGNTYIYNVNTAGRVNQVFDWGIGGTFPSFIANIYSETAGKFGNFSGSNMSCTVMNCLFDFANPISSNTALPDYHINTSRGVTFIGCVFRNYTGQLIPVVLAGEGGLFKSCGFEVPPVLPNIDTLQAEYHRFEDCNLTLAGGILGAKGKFVGIPNQFTNFNSYGEFSIVSSTSLRSGISTEYTFNGDRVRGEVRDVSYAITVTGTGNGRQFTFASGFPDFYNLNNPIILYDGGSVSKFAGIVTNISGANITVGYVPESITNGTWLVIQQVPLKVYGFMGDATSGSADITNCLYDDMVVSIGDYIASDLFYGHVRVKNIVGSTVTMAIGAQATAPKTYFAPHKTTKVVRTLMGNSSPLSNISNATLFKKGGFLIDNRAGIESKYPCITSGCYNQAPFAVFSGFGFTLNADGSRDIGTECFVDFFVTPVSDLTNFKAGTTNGGTEIQPNITVLAADLDTAFMLRYYMKPGQTIYFGGITSSTQIKIIATPIT